MLRWYHDASQCDGVLCTLEDELLPHLRDASEITARVGQINAILGPHIVGDDDYHFG